MGDIHERRRRILHILSNSRCEKCRFFDHKTGAVKDCRCGGMFMCASARESGATQEKNLWVTRKGATSAREGQYGIIPGSMGAPASDERSRSSEESLKTP